MWQSKANERQRHIPLRHLSRLALGGKFYARICIVNLFLPDQIFGLLTTFVSPHNFYLCLSTIRRRRRRKLESSFSRSSRTRRECEKRKKKKKTTTFRPTDRPTEYLWPRPTQTAESRRRRLIGRFYHLSRGVANERTSERRRETKQEEEGRKNLRLISLSDSSHLGANSV